MKRAYIRQRTTVMGKVGAVSGSRAGSNPAGRHKIPSTLGGTSHGGGSV